MPLKAVNYDAFGNGISKAFFKLIFYLKTLILIK